MDFLTMMTERRSCRSYQARSVEREKLEKLAEAGRLTPSACNSQPWHFIVVDEAEAKEKLCDALVLANGATSCPWRETAPAFIAVCECPAQLFPGAGDHQRFAQGDVGAAAMNICHAAMELGLSTCILGMVDQEKMRRHFGVPEEVQVRVIIAVGYGAEETAVPKKRKPLEEVCGFNRW